MARAPACWLRYEDHFHGDIIMQDVFVPKEADSDKTYCATLVWNGGIEGGGYCGIQNHTHPEGKNYIFSMWSSILHPDIPIEASFKGPGTEVAHFSHEGTGLKSSNFTLGWELDQWYTNLVRKWDHQDHTFFGYWVHDLTGNKWTHLVTMKYPSPQVDFMHSTGCFIEDWAGTGEPPREVHYRHGFKRRNDRSWFPFITGHWSVNQGAHTAQYNDNYNAGVKNGYFFMQTGDHFTPAPYIVGRKHVFHNHDIPSHPHKRPIHFTITSATHDEVTWHVDQQETPQFSYRVSVDRDPYPVAADVDSETRSVKLNVGSASEVEVTLEDVLGHKVTKTKIIP